MIRSATPVTMTAATAGEQPEVASFIEELRCQETAAKTWQNYCSDLVCFGRWFAGTNDEPFTAAAVTPTDIREYRGFLLNVERRTPATVNRRLAALRKFFGWAKATGLVEDEPTSAVKGIESSPRAPK